MNKLPLGQNLGLFFVLLFFMASPPDAYSVTLASQTQDYSTNLDVRNVIQELGDNLNGTLDKFTFRVRTNKTNLEQFNFTAGNTRIFDKFDNSTILACTPSGNSSQLAGLTFNTSGIPAGYEDVTLDFSCRNYNFIPGHKYLIRILSGSSTGLILFGAAAYGPGGSQTTDLFTKGGLRYGNGNTSDTANNGGSCDAFQYIWNSQTAYKGCIPFTTPKDDLYFTLTNTTPEPTPSPSPTPTPAPSKTPVVFIPGIGGSELKASQDIVWSASDGHGGTYQHAYANNEKIWINQDEATKLGDDDYFDVLRLKSDGQTSEVALSLTGNLNSSGYGEIDSFFTGMGYTKGTNFFVFNYDWRKDIRSTKDSLDSLIEEAKTKSGQSKINIVAHSMGGLVARYYISDSSKAAKVNHLIEIGVPHLGTTNAMKIIMYGFALQKNVFGFIPMGIPSNEIKDISQNASGVFQLLPSGKYFTFYDNSGADRIYPFRDDRDIDTNNATGSLNYDQTKSLLSNLNFNMTIFGISEQFHNTADPLLDQTNGVTIHEIVGTAQPTLGQIHETWWITWPINIINKTEEIFINGDDTVPIYSASLKSSSLDLSAGATIYYTNQTHSDLVSSVGSAMQTVKAILNISSLPVEVKGQKIDLEGQQITLDDGELELYDNDGRHTGIKDNGEIETNIPDTFYSTSGKTKHAFVKSKVTKVTIKVTSKTKTSSDPTTTNIKIRTYKQDTITKTVVYKDVPIKNSSVKVEFILDPAIDTTPSLILYPDSTKPENTFITSTSEVTGGTALDQTPPKTTIKIESSIVTLSAIDEGAGVLKIEYSLDNGVTVKTYNGPFTITNTGKTTLQVKAIDKLGNEEMPQEKIVEVSSSSSSSSSSNSISSSSTSSSTSDTTESKITQASNLNSAELTSQSESQHQERPTSEVLGITSNDSPKIAASSLPSIKEQVMLLLILLPNILPGLMFGLSGLSFFRK